MPMEQEMIAVVGEGCVLPGCKTPQELWKLVEQGRSAIRKVPEGRWRVDPAAVLATGKNVSGDEVCCTEGGYVTDYAWNPAMLPGREAYIQSLDPLFQWSLESAFHALQKVKGLDDGVRKKTSVILGNLSYPTASHSKLYEEEALPRLLPEIFQSGSAIHHDNRYGSSLPARLISDALGLGGNAFCLDAACASSLYAMKIACDQLQAGTSDLVLAGGVNAADSLFLHLGFSALNALSPTGQSRPFHRQADGLIPAEGAAFLALKRLSDALRDGDEILGLVRGIGLSNDGRSGGFLSPSVQGQKGAMTQAYEKSGIDPATISYIECHATGTVTGDSKEIESMSEIFGRDRSLCIGSLKGNIGHLITASGAASVIKVLHGFRNQVLPNTAACSELNPALQDTGFYLPANNSPWTSGTSPRRAAVNGFGFGGNNAHVILEEWNPAAFPEQQAYASVKQQEALPQAVAAPVAKRVALVSLELKYGGLDTPKALTQFIGDPEGFSKRGKHLGQAERVALHGQRLGFPPKDLDESLGQQTLLLELLDRQQETLGQLNAQETGVFIGMEVDSETNSVGLRANLETHLKKAGYTLPPQELKALRDTVCPPLSPARVIGCMPNVPANRISNKYNFEGQGFTLSSGRLSGNEALTLALNAIRDGELESAIVGAVDLVDPLLNHPASLLPAETSTVDAAIVWILCDDDIARQRKFPVLATFTVDDCAAPHASAADSATAEMDLLLAKVGNNVLVRNLLELSLPVLGAVNRLQHQPLIPLSAPPIDMAGGISMDVCLERTPLLTSDVDGRKLALFSGESIAELKANLLQGHFSTNAQGVPHMRTGFFFATEEEYQQRKEACLQNLDRVKPQQGYANGVCFYPAQLEGELAFVFTGAASAYPQAAQDLLSSYPLLASAMQREFGGSLVPFCGWMYPEWSDAPSESAAFNDLAGSSFVCQLHAKISRAVWGLEPDAAFGLSSGETNSIFALGLWQGLDALFHDIWQSDLYQKALAGSYETVKRFWGMDPGSTVNWQSWVLFCDASIVSALIAQEERVYLTIISADRECVIAGDADGCQRILDQLPDVHHTPLNHEIACHCPVLGDFEPTWKNMHTRAVHGKTTTKFYSNFFGGEYTPTRESVAEALTGQAATCLDFPKIVRKAFNDGVRIFLEHGPRDSLSRSIRAILSPQESARCLVLSMDVWGSNAVEILYRNTLELWCSGQHVDLNGFCLRGKKVNKLMFDLRKPLPQPRSGVANVRQEERSMPAVAAIHSMESFVMPKPPFLREAAHLEAPASSLPPMPEQAAPQAATPVATTPAAATPQATGVEGLIQQIFQQQSQVHIEYMALQLQSYEVYSQGMNRQLHALLENAGSPRLPEAAPVVPEPTLVAEERVAAPQAIIPAAAPFKPLPVAKKPEPVAQVVKKPQPIAPVVEKQKPEETESVTAAYDYTPTGPSYSREQLEILASGEISGVFGAAFKEQDSYPIQVRMPEPPLLLCDRVTGIEAVPKSMEKGIVWTETDVLETSWYIHNGHMPAGVLIEAGQADLLLISYLGIDFLNKGERAYRLLGCELEIFGDLPKVGDTLKYKICVDGHAKSGDVRLFFFHYDCYINGQKCISVKNGQAGFFTPEELKDSSGVLWTPEEAAYSSAPMPQAPIPLQKDRFSSLEVSKYLKGDLVGCFGDAFFLTQPHARTPKSSSGKMNFIQQIAEISVDGGPAGRGYLRANTKITPDDWFFNGHFKNDPCMPGTLMAEGCLQMMSFYLTALGYTQRSDGWRFQPTTNTKFQFHCRGQVVPESQALIYELFIDEIVAAPFPTLYAHVLCTVDGRKAFLCERLGVQLVPGWPLLDNPISDPMKGRVAVASYNGFPFDQASLFNCAWGKPSDAFGERYAVYNNEVRSPRLPGPPYLFMSRITQFDAEFGNPHNKPSVVAEYDVPEDAWFFRDNSSNSMPYCVLMEIALQPCGWLASFCRNKELHGMELLFRNLDGLKAIQHVDIPQGNYVMRSEVTMTSVSRTGTLIINQFEIKTFANDRLVYSYQTTFGFFPPEAMIAQKGLKISDNDQALLDLPSNIELSLLDHPEDYFGYKSPRLPASKLLMLDRIVRYDPCGGEGKLGYMRGEKDVNPDDWFFKAHFFQDPVQPGSLGVEAILQLMQAYMLTSEPALMQCGREFEPVVIGEAVEWHYRGQITPEKTLICVDMEVTEEFEDEKGRLLWAKAKVWVDGLKIYELPRVGMRLKGADRPQVTRFVPWQLDSATAPWALDHCPTYCVPALPFTYLVELALEATGADLEKHGVHCNNIDIKSWMTLTENPESRLIDPPLTIEGDVEVVRLQGDSFTFVVAKKDYAKAHPLLEAPLLACGTGDVAFLMAAELPDFPAISPLSNGISAELPYDNHAYFHGPAFQLLQALTFGDNGASAVISAASRGVPHGRSGFALLDAALQAIPHESLNRWCNEVSQDLVAYPCRIKDLMMAGSLPDAGTLEVQARFIGKVGEMFVESAVWILDQGTVIAHFMIVEMLVPKGISKSMSAEERFRFFSEREKLSSHKVISHSTENGDCFSLALHDVKASDWLPGTLEQTYGIATGLDIKQKTQCILLKEYLADLQSCHPSQVCINADLALNPVYLLQNHGILLSETGEGFEIRPSKPRLRIHSFELEQLLQQKGFAPSLLTDLVLSLCDRFVGDVKFADLEEAKAVGPCIFLANHQVAIESFLFGVLGFAILGRPITTISKAENKEHWLGQFQDFAIEKYRESNPLEILYFQRENPTELLQILSGFLEEMAVSEKSLFVHAGGTREQSEGEGIAKMSSFVIDQAVRCDKPIIPVLFSNGLPMNDQGKKHELPVHFTGQSYTFGKAIMPAEFQALNSAQRVALYLQRMDALAGERQDIAVDSDFREKVASLSTSRSISPFAAVCILVLQERENLSQESVDFLECLNQEGVSEKVKTLLPIF